MQPSTMTRGLRVDTHLRRMLFFLMFILFNCNNIYLQLNRLLVRVAITTTTPVAPNNDKRDLTTIQAVAPNNDKRGSRRASASRAYSRASTTTATVAPNLNEDKRGASRASGNFFSFYCISIFLQLNRLLGSPANTTTTNTFILFSIYNTTHKHRYRAFDIFKIIRSWLV